MEGGSSGRILGEGFEYTQYNELNSQRINEIFVKRMTRKILENYNP